MVLIVLDVHSARVFRKAVSGLLSKPRLSDFKKSIAKKSLLR
jgi:hypothetical protein